MLFLSSLIYSESILSEKLNNTTTWFECASYLIEREDLVVEIQDAQGLTLLQLKMKEALEVAVNNETKKATLAKNIGEEDAYNSSTYNIKSLNIQIQKLDKLHSEYNAVANSLLEKHKVVNDTYLSRCSKDAIYEQDDLIKSCKLFSGKLNDSVTCKFLYRLDTDTGA